MGMEVDLGLCPQIPNNLQIDIYHHAICLFHAPSDLSGSNFMHHEYIWANPQWHNDGPCHDCVFIQTGSEDGGFWAFEVAQVHFFLSFIHKNTTYHCAYVHWFNHWGDGPCDKTRMWIVVLHIVGQNHQLTTIIPINAIFCSAHLIPVWGSEWDTPQNLRPLETLDTYPLYYVNKYTDHLSHEIGS